MQRVADAHRHRLAVVVLVGDVDVGRAGAPAAATGDQQQHDHHKWRDSPESPPQSDSGEWRDSPESPPQSDSGESLHILKDISFVAQPGETVAIVGQTGSGKSTLTRLINRIFDAEGGQVLVDGIDVRDWNLESLRSQISTIEQDVFLFSRTIAENIAFGVPDATREQIEAVAHEAQAHDFIMSFEKGYDTEVGERGVTLSGGQRQRIAIARAFLTNPRILILDDSTSAIDSATEDRIQQAMYRISRQRTTFLITHRLSQIRWADRILVLKGGRITDQGTHDELLARSADYQRIFSVYE
ncbi:MAG: ATP-binding cassette domain-containing protein [Anaerolineae bacterium]|nr:ATP-binding cassette domain-containing protein [Anaerolineae bacterium]